jgi:hypothetical protein
MSEVRQRLGLAGVVVGLLASTLSAGARADVVGALAMGLRHEPLKDLRFDLAGQLRLDEAMSRLERFMPEVGVGYEPIKPLSLGTGYRLIYARNGAGDFELAHRVHVQAGLATKLKVIHSKLKYRLRLQDRFERTEGEPTDHDPALRNGLALSYTKLHLFDPFVSAEHYLALDRLDDEPTRRWRFMIGAERDFGASELTLYYRYDLRPGDDDEPYRHLIGLELRYDL